MLDVAPFTVAIETNELAPLVIIPRNTTIPCSFKKSFSNYLSDDGSISIKVKELKIIESSY